MPVRDLLSAASGASSAGPADPYFYDVSLLLNGDGTNGAQNNTFLDSSTNNFTITRNGNTTQGSFSPYGNLWSNYLPGSSYLSAPNNAVFNFSGDYTIEAWVYFNSAITTAQSILSNYTGSAGTASGFDLYPKSVSGTVAFRYFINNGEQIVGSIVPAAGTWYHIAVCRSGSSTKMFVNGVQDGSTYTNSSSFTSTATLKIGSTDGASEYLNGYISNVRIVNGTAVYTSNFTPSTTPLTAITNTVLLTAQSNRFIDNSSNAFSITVNGSPSVQRFSPFNPTAPYSTSVIGGSGYFGASSDYLSMSAQTAFNVSGGNWTIEFWYYRAAAAGTTVILENNSNGLNGYSIQTDTSNNLVLYVNSNIITSSSPMQLNAWSHCALVRSGSTTTMYINGASVGTSSTDAGSTNGGLWIGARSGGSFGISGYMTDLRIVKGTAVYTTTFAPPTAPLTAITNTSLLENFTNAGIPDLAMQNDLQTVGSAQVSTSVKKYGTGSLSFNGSNSYLKPPAIPQYQLGSGDFTVEGWVYKNSNTAYMAFCGTFASASTNTWQIISDASGSYPAWYNGASNSFILTSSVAVSTGAWNHIAFVRSGTTLTVYINGVSGGSATLSTNYNATSSLYVGQAPELDGGRYWNGYIDDFRITNGLARYTANFTPPTAALPTY